MTHPLDPPAAAPRRESPLLRALARGALRLTGWRIAGRLPPVAKFVAIVAPHTSNWDFLVGIATLFALDVHVRWLGKHTIFRPPFGWLLRRLGGRPVRRTRPEGVVTEVSAMIRDEPRIIVALAPEGTRRRVDRWRSGFYRIAEAAAVPIVPVWLDWERREIGIGAPLDPSGDLPGDLRRLMAVFEPRMARRPEYFWAAQPEAGRGASSSPPAA